MDFLKSILGDDLYEQVSSKVNEYNEANKDNQVKLADLGKGEYVGKGKYDSLNDVLTGKNKELEQANTLIAELKKGTKGNEELQNKITDYDNTVKSLQQELQETKIKSAIKVALLSDKAIDVDYLTFKLQHKLNEENKHLELDENDNIKGWKELSEDLHISYPNQFESSASKKINEHKLDEGDKSKNITRTDILKMSYQDRNKLYNENPELYKNVMNN